MNMERKMLYNFMRNSYISITFHQLDRIYDFYFNEQIGFPECHIIQEDIKEHICNGITNFIIDYCDFIKEINIELESTINYNDGLWYNDSILQQFDNNKINIKLIERDWSNDNTCDWFDYNIIRYSLYIAYYRHLKKTNPEHDFVKFVEFLSRVDFYNPSSEEYISIYDYINSLEESQQKEIDESLFHEVRRVYSSLMLNKSKFHLCTE